jgi:hypothetical protein
LGDVDGQMYKDWKQRNKLWLLFQANTLVTLDMPIDLIPINCPFSEVFAVRTSNGYCIMLKSV